jgi:hypothetical protein
MHCVSQIEVDTLPIRLETGIHLFPKPVFDGIPEVIILKHSGNESNRFKAMTLPIPAKMPGVVPSGYRHTPQPVVYRDAIAWSKLVPQNVITYD